MMAARTSWCAPPSPQRPAPPARKGYTARMNDETLEQIQTKIAFLERASAELSDVVFRQHKEIQALETKLQALVDRLSGAQSDDGPRLPEQERPPHY
jgi:uncharacterized coiled-coil protein SlyX